jgi:predicted nuclease of predicted toxin-antitoxin system
VHIAVLASAGHNAQHWTEVGDPRATDELIMQWARDRSAIVFTHDLDFSAILAATTATGPSVLQVRADDVLPVTLASTVLSAVDQFKDELSKGAIVVVEPWRSRCRILPLKPS